MSFSARLARAAGQLFLALLDATLILVILAALAIGFAVGQIREAAEKGAERVAVAALSAAEIERGEIRIALRALSQEMERLRTALEEGAGEDRLAPALAQVEVRLAEVRDALDALQNPSIRIDPATVTALGAAAEAFLARFVENREPPARAE